MFSTLTFWTGYFPDARKAILIILIISITASSVYLIVKIMRQKQYQYSPKYLLLVSLAVGDILLALFALVVRVQSLFRKTESGLETCRLNFYSDMYSNHFINFVYGVGLIVLAAEFVYRRRCNRPRTTTHFDLVRSFVICIVPWLLGLIVMLPLGLAGVDLETCNVYAGLEITRAQIVVSTILPACLAVIAAVVVVCFKMDRGYVQHLEMTSGDQTLASGQCTDDIAAQHKQPDAINVPAYNLNPPYNPSYYPPQNQTSGDQTLASGQGTDDIAAQHRQPDAINVPANNLNPPHNPSYYPPQNQPHNPPMGYYPNPGNVNTGSSINNVIIVTNDSYPIIPPINAIYPEQKKILSLAFIFFFLVTPQMICVLILISNVPESLTMVGLIFTAGFNWLTLFRPVVTALVSAQSGYLTQA
ncbi:uncharacterized protein LOC131956438 [Physella acuta]|uniref:uncharacterized protein LOC131956438 n=1 Tax=Physella acuta TaxID=109671 RepID=UPI0027DAF7F3|nr:uncharacterized protein LOC131956438 [Physella acuta]